MLEKFTPPEARENPQELVDNFEGPELSPMWSTKRITPGGWQFTDEVSEGRNALKITLRPGELPSVGHKNNPRERAEISEIKEISVPPETQAIYSFRFYIPEDFPLEDENVVIAQIKQPVQNKEHPVISLRCYGDKLKLVIIDANEQDVTKHKISLPYTANEWHSVSLSYQLNTDRQGTCTVTLDDQEPQTYAGHMGYDNLPQDGMYFKMGIYRPAVPKEQSIYFSDFTRELKKPGI